VSVYCDNADIPYRNPKTGYEMLMSHLLADSLEELHKMADALGIDRSYFQDKHTPHYDICKKKRMKAHSLGVIAVDRRQMNDLIKQWRVSKDEGVDRIRGLNLVEKDQYGLGL
jgi:hypothetical protein